MKLQTWIQTDLGYTITKEKLILSKLDISTDGQDYGGRFTFHLKKMKDFTFQITTNGKVGITYPKGSNYDVGLEQLKPFLVKAEGTPATIIGATEQRSRLSSSVPLQKRTATVQDSVTSGEAFDMIAEARTKGIDLEIVQKKKGFVEKLKDLLDYKISVP